MNSLSIVVRLSTLRSFYCIHYSTIARMNALCTFAERMQQQSFSSFLRMLHCCARVVFSRTQSHLARGVDSASVAGGHVNGRSNYYPGYCYDGDDQSGKVAVDEEEGDSDWEGVVRARSVLGVLFRKRFDTGRRGRERERGEERGREEGREGERKGGREGGRERGRGEGGKEGMREGGREGGGKWRGREGGEGRGEGGR